MSPAVVPPSPAATVAAGVTLPLVSGALVVLRFYSKRVQRLDLFVEDWLTIPAFLLASGMGVGLVYGVARKALAYPAPQPADPKNLPNFTAPEITINRQLEYAILMMQIPAITCAKLGFLFLYKRVFCTGVENRVKYGLWFTILLCTAWGISFFVSFLFICGTHPSALWGTLLAFKQHCQHILDWNFWMSISDFILDVIIFLIPMPLLWGLHMSTTRKLAVLTVFMFGAVTLAASITRMVIFVRAVQSLKTTYKSKAKGSDNLTITAGLYWTTFECGMALIAVCLPSIYSLLKKTLHEQFGFQTTHSKGNHGLSGKFSNTTYPRKGRTHGSDSDMIPLEAPVITTDIEIHFGDKARSEASHRELRPW